MNREAWLWAAVRQQSDECIVWPFAVTPAGYPVVTIGGRKNQRAHIASCESAHGPRPTPTHQAAHSCGVRACVNPRHLRWATPAENAADRDLHNTTARGERHAFARLTDDMVLELRRRVAAGESVRGLARETGLDRGTVRGAVKGHTWKHLPMMTAAAVALSSCALARPHVETPAGPRAEPSAQTVAFCGPTTSNPHWREQLWTLRTIGITAVHGYCYTPPADYQVLQPGARYASQAEYLELAAEAQRIGVGVVAYDPMFWTDPERAAAVWADYIADGTLVAVDLGDEPGSSDMAELDRRAELVRTAGVEPQTIFVGSGPGVMGNVLDQHAALPTACPISDDYGNNAGAMADAFALRLSAGCAGIAIDTTGRDLDGNGDRWSVDQIRRARAAGMRITLFTGVQPDNFPTWDALVDDGGRITEAGRAVREALA